MPSGWVWSIKITNNPVSSFDDMMGKQFCLLTSHNKWKLPYVDSLMCLECCMVAICIWICFLEVVRYSLVSSFSFFFIIILFLSKRRKNMRVKEISNQFYFLTWAFGDHTASLVSNVGTWCYGIVGWLISKLHLSW